MEEFLHLLRKAANCGWRCGIVLRLVFPFCVVLCLDCQWELRQPHGGQSRAWGPDQEVSFTLQRNQNLQLTLVCSGISGFALLFLFCSMLNVTCHSLGFWYVCFTRPQAQPGDHFPADPGRRRTVDHQQPSEEDPWTRSEYCSFTIFRCVKISVVSDQGAFGLV